MMGISKWYTVSINIINHKHLIAQQLGFTPTKVCRFDWLWRVADTKSWREVFDETGRGMMGMNENDGVSFHRSSMMVNALLENPKFQDFNQGSKQVE